MESAAISKLVRADGLALLRVQNVQDAPGVAAAVFRSLADVSVNVYDIVQNASPGVTDISFLVDAADGEPALDAIFQAGFPGAEMTRRISVFAIYGASFKNDPTVFARMTGQCGAVGANIRMISTSAVRLTIVVSNDRSDRLSTALENEFAVPCQLSQHLP